MKPTHDPTHARWPPCHVSKSPKIKKNKKLKNQFSPPSFWFTYGGGGRHPPPPPPPPDSPPVTNPPGLRPPQRHRHPSPMSVLSSYLYCRRRASTHNPLPPAAATDSTQTTSVEDPIMHPPKKKYHLCFNSLSLDMFSILNSQGVVLSTVIAVSGIVIFLALTSRSLFRLPNSNPLR